MIPLKTIGMENGLVSTYHMGVNTFSTIVIYEGACLNKLENPKDRIKNLSSIYIPYLGF